MALTQPDGEVMSIYDAAMSYIARGTPTVIFAGEEYGTGSLARLGRQRDTAAGRKGGHRQELRAHPSFESRLHGRSALPIQRPATRGNSLGIDGTEEFDLVGLDAGIRPQMDVTLVIRRRDGSATSVPLLLRIDTPIEVDYYLHGGILPFVLRELLAA